jgi:hypothetical protein
MSPKPGSIYKVGGRRYVDSQAVYNLAAAHEVVPQPDGWRVMVGGGAVRCATVDRPELPHQRGGLYELSAEGGVSLKGARVAWLSGGLVKAAGTFDTWPGDEPPAKTGCGCGKTCGCAPCRLKHAHNHE